MFVPGQTVGANAIHWDLWHVANSGYSVVLEAVVPIPSGAAAVTGLVAVDIFLNRTTAVGTGGTAATYEGTSFTAMTICGQDNSQALTSSIVTARLTPTGGATAGAVLSWRSLATEETLAGTYNQINNMARLYHTSVGIVIPQGKGVSVVQGSVASVGVVGYEVAFSVTSK